MATRTILLVEDEDSIALPLAAALEREGYATRITGSAPEAIALAAELQPDLVLLDVMLRDGSGLDVCREVRRHSRVPIIMLTARGDETDRVVGLELGADDYVVKPFSARELVARIRAVLRRVPDDAPAAPGAASAVRVGGVTVDVALRRVAARRRGARTDAARVRPARAARAQRGHRAHARAPDRRGLGHELVRVDEDARRARLEPAPQARRRRRRTRATCTPCAASASASRRPTSSRG